MSTKDEKLYIVMVGLPSQGKSTIAYRLKDIFNKNEIPTRVFNNGQVRRQYARSRNTWAADFFRPDNVEAAELRKRFALMNIAWARKYVNSRGQVAVLDATNVSLERRNLLVSSLNDHPILFIECINNDEEIVDMSIALKVKSPEFSHLSEGLAGLSRRRQGFDSPWDYQADKPGKSSDPRAFPLSGGR